MHSLYSANIYATINTTAVLRGKKREKLDKICSDFEANEERMRDGEFLAEGYSLRHRRH